MATTREVSNLGMKRILAALLFLTLAAPASERSRDRAKKRRMTSRPNCNVHIASAVILHEILIAHQAWSIVNVMSRGG